MAHQVGVFGCHVSGRNPAAQLDALAGHGDGDVLDQEGHAGEWPGSRRLLFGRPGFDDGIQPAVHLIQGPARQFGQRRRRYLTFGHEFGKSQSIVTHVF